MKKTTNIPKAFISFLIASFLMWLLINLSKKYTTEVKYKVTYVKLAQDKMLQETPIEEVSFLVKGSGFKLLSSSFSNETIQLSAENLRKKSKNDYYFLTNNQKTNIQKQLHSGLVLETVLQDTIHLKLGKLQTKKVVLNSNLNLNYELGYNLVDSVIIPDSILISGPELQLSKISELSLEKLELENVSEDIDIKRTVILPKEFDKVNMSSTEAQIKIFVDKFTEGEFEIPVKIENLPKGEKINVFPKKIKVIFNVGLKNFNKISEDSFEVVCDYKETKKKELTYLLPKLKSKSNQVSSVRLIPDKIEFLIRK